MERNLSIWLYLMGEEFSVWKENSCRSWLLAHWFMLFATTTCTDAQYHFYYHFEWPFSECNTPFVVCIKRDAAPVSLSWKIKLYMIFQWVKNLPPLRHRWILLLRIRRPFFSSFFAVIQSVSLCVLHHVIWILEIEVWRTNSYSVIHAVALHEWQILLWNNRLACWHTYTTNWKTRSHTNTL